MGLKFGFNIGTSDMKSLLEKNERQMSGVRSWKQLFGSAAQSYQSQASALTSAYSDTIAQAYRSSMAQADAIASAGLNLGATQELIANNRAALHSAYQTYVQNYGQAVNTNAQNYANTVAAYDKELTARAENFSKLYNYAYKYLAEELVGSTYTGNAGGSIANGTSWLTANKLDWLYDPTTGQAKTWRQLTTDENNPLVDQTTSELTSYGREFFDAMFNASTRGYQTTKGEATRGFDEWLSDTDADLRDWYVSGDVYNYNLRGTNLGTAKALLGLGSTDVEYATREHAANHFGELSKEMAAPSSDALKESELKYYQKQEKAGKALDNKLGSTNKIEQWYQGKVADMHLKKAEKLYTEYAHDLSTYITEYNKIYTSTLTDIKNLLGTDNYNAWAAENRDLITQISNYIGSGGTKGYMEWTDGVDPRYKADTAGRMTKELKDLYQFLLNSVDKFIKKNESLSGF